MSSGSTGMEQPVHDDLAAARLAWAQWRSVSMDSAFAAVMGDALPTSLEAIRVDLPDRLRADPTFMNAVTHLYHHADPSVVLSVNEMMLSMSGEISEIRVSALSKSRRMTEAVPSHGWQVD